MRLMRYQYSVAIVLGKNLCTADALSRQPVSSPEDTDEVAQIEVEEYMSTFMQSLPASEKRLTQIKALQENDSVQSCQAIYKQRVAS